METPLVLSTRHAQLKQAWYQRTDPVSRLAPRQFVVGLVQHPQTGFFQVWLSTNGLDVISVSARRRIVDAEADVQAIKRVLGSQDIYQEDKLVALFARIEEETDEPPCTLPASLVHQICQAIALRVGTAKRSSCSPS